MYNKVDKYQLYDTIFAKQYTKKTLTCTNMTCIIARFDSNCF